uniref:At1g61320/AtMIF1 LRR domain-containing protein n=1 Tax=Quercus lobata TaxID=97700 RepID=A0A7N2R9D3_QUELO
MHAKPAYYPAGGGPFHTDYTRHLFIIDEAVMASMLSTCTLLEGLTLDACNVVSNLIVTGPPSLRLKKLKVRYCSATKIEISAANLIAFDFSGDITRISSFSAPRLLEVRFNTGTKASTFAHGLAQFASHPCLENLSLIMYSSTVKEIPQSIPLFKNLKELNMNIWNSSCGSEEDELLWVLFILKATPLLQKLELTVSHEILYI